MITLSPTALKILQQCDLGVRPRRLIELDIVERVLTEAINQHRLIFVDDGEGDRVQYIGINDALEAIFSVDDCHIYLPMSRHMDHYPFIQFVLGNSGWDVIADYNVSLEKFLEPIEDYIDSMWE